MGRSDDDQVVGSAEEARAIARQFALEQNLPEEQAIAAAGTWFDAGKDEDSSGGDALRRFLARRLVR